jgi:DNA-binding transcriptional LysR family regulator
VNLETLRLYCEVVRLSSFSRGALANNISQSAASQAIRQLEGDLNVRLLDRTKRPFMVTPEGQTFYEACRTLLQGYEKAIAEISSGQTRVAETVRVAAIYSVGLHSMSQPIQAFKTLHPDATVKLECLHPHKVVEAVLKDEADLGILSYPPRDRTLTVLPWHSETMGFVCHPRHPLAHRKVISPRDLHGEKFIAFDADLSIRKAVDRYLRQYAVKVSIVMEFDNIETIKQAIAIAGGVSILPLPTVTKEGAMRTLAIAPLAPPGLSRPIGIIHRRHKALTPIVALFIDLLQQRNGQPQAHSRNGRRSEPSAPRKRLVRAR